ncbi:ESX secretion-associated protein EspG [Mycobacterium sp. 236(2023)]|uniref:ESX secretion-associated protein EspG n=1 Tax=Mycobacterium sp. 236(2023) TaxID=3038163 RepID=UPI00241545F9|nr:ESX secretion-associated protein EspG [Mycobacterium sp. 236(2023)]MDG4667957.1 ESX secretion-associated protein EspG [Mycobacterium sp. 236(2023)]
MSLTTTVNGLWILQALLGIETMPVALRVKPFIPSVHGELVVDTTAGPLPIQQTGEYLGLVAAGVIDARGDVDDIVRDWMTVLGRPERQVLLMIRRPNGHGTDGTPLVHERIMAVCQHRRWLAMIARDGDEVVIDAVGEADSPSAQVELMCQPLLAALGDSPAAQIDGFNLPTDLLQSTMEHAHAGGRDTVTAAMARLGLQPQQAEVLAAGTRHDESAMAVVAVVDRGISHHVHPQVLTVADTEYGRISMTTTTGADGRQWMSMWPATVAELADDLARLLAAPKAA